MGCGCKNTDIEPISESVTEKKKFSFKKENIDQEITTFLLRKNKFSFICIYRKATYFSKKKI